MHVVRYELTTVTWRKSSYSTDAGDDCVEIADNIPGTVVPVRDSKNPHGPALAIPARAWAAFVTALQTAERP
ncbi:DUF397 domain-containing protein [Streptomyces sp. NPDC026206]|uniref:DUF397 domain-containing protein n=1 Tax=Streptomyces sp. NPDC026206 TaxID=3157089 RepID=UPI0033E52B06